MEKEERGAVIRIIQMKEEGEERADSGFSESPLKRPGSVEIKPSKRIKTELCEPSAKQGKEKSLKSIISKLKCAFCKMVSKGRSDLYSHYSYMH